MYCATGLPGCGRGGRAGRQQPEAVPDRAAQGLSRDEEARMLEEEEMKLKEGLDDLETAIADLSDKNKKEVNK